MRHLRSLRRTLLVLTALTLCADAAGAQRRTRFELLDEDVEPLQRLLRADIAVVQWYMQSASDPLAELQRVAKFPLVPPGARYEAQCTRGHANQTKIIFSLADTNPPRSAPAPREPIAGGIDTVQLPGHGMSIAGFFDTVEKGTGALAPWGDRMNARTAWYDRNGYSIVPDNDFVAGRTRALDRRRRVVVDVEGPLLNDRECLHVRGPAIGIGIQRLHDDGANMHEPFEDSVLVHPFERAEGAPKSEVEEAFEEALHDAGLTEPEFRQLYEVIVNTAAGMNLTAEQQELARGQMSELGRERTEANALWFREHGHAVMPLIEARRRAFEQAR